MRNHSSFGAAALTADLQLSLATKTPFKVREGRRAADCTKSCVFHYYTAISEHI